MRSMRFCRRPPHRDRLPSLPCHCSHVHRAEVFVSWQVLVQCVGWVDGLVLFGRILAGILQDDLWTTRVL